MTGEELFYLDPHETKELADYTKDAGTPPAVVYLLIGGVARGEVCEDVDLAADSADLVFSLLS